MASATIPLLSRTSCRSSHRGLRGPPYFNANHHGAVDTGGAEKELAQLQGMQHPLEGTCHSPKSVVVCISHRRGSCCPSAADGARLICLGSSCVTWFSALDRQHYRGSDKRRRERDGSRILCPHQRHIIQSLCPHAVKAVCPSSGLMIAMVMATSVR
jgi:hypothetical protein